MFNNLIDNWYIMGMVVFVVASTSYMDYLDFKVPHNSGFFSLTDGFWDAWHITKNLTFVVLFYILGKQVDLSIEEWILYGIFTIFTMFYLHEIILHGKIN